MTPARLVTGLITERGVVAASRAALEQGFPGARVPHRRQTGGRGMSAFRARISRGSGRRPPVGDRARGRARHHAAPAVARFLLVSELPLASGRRADLVALGAGGEIWIVEIKSSVADFRADQKWMDYRLHCDRLFFATTCEVPCEIFPKDTGLIVADAFGAEIVCEAPEHRLPAATRKAMMLRIAHCAALRLQSLIDPSGPYGEEI